MLAIWTASAMLLHTWLQDAQLEESHSTTLSKEYLCWALCCAVWLSVAGLVLQ